MIIEILTSFFNLVILFSPVDMDLVAVSISPSPLNVAIKFSIVEFTTKVGKNIWEGISKKPASIV